MPYAPVNGIDLFYESHGDGPAIVFLHGRGGNHLAWWQQIPHFADRFRCIAIDHREFGLTKEVKNGPGRKAFADDRMWFMRVDAILPDAFSEFIVKRLSELKK